jgi:ribosomal protein S18 acetylase RimI-like enzyme
MKEFIKITDKNDILRYLYDFSDVFPHLCEKIESMEEYAAKLSKFSNFYIASYDGAELGLAVFYSNDKQSKNAYISLIGLKSVARNKGLGSWLLNRCEEASIKDGMEKMSLEVDCDNPSAIAFYKKNGYCQGEFTNRSSMYMHKVLGEDCND